MAIEKFGFTNDIFEHEQMHCVSLYVTATCPDGEAENREPGYCRQWKWFELDDLPQPLFLPLANLLNEEPDANGVSILDRLRSEVLAQRI